MSDLADFWIDEVRTRGPFGTALQITEIPAPNYRTIVLVISRQILPRSKDGETMDDIQK